MSINMVNWLKYCEHVYRSVKKDPCPICGGDSHETDWDLLREQRKAHREKHGLFYVVKEWWSI